MRGILVVSALLLFLAAGSGLIAQAGHGGGEILRDLDRSTQGHGGGEIL